MVCNLRTREGVPETVYNQWVQAPDFVGANGFLPRFPPLRLLQARRLTVG